MKFLNLGCGYHYSSQKEWVNIDFAQTGPEVIASNLLNGIPCEDNTFDLVYHSHVLEHFSKEDAVTFLKECYRVLKPGGVIRVVVPDLEGIIRNYQRFLDQGLLDEEDSLNQANYDWTVLELFDQTVRNLPGGQMADYLSKTMPNKEFVMGRLGKEGEQILDYLQSHHYQQSRKGKDASSSVKSWKHQLKKYLLNRFFGEFELKNDASKAHEDIGKFRLGGEIHQWMYDRYSLKRVLKSCGFSAVELQEFNTSKILDWNGYELDGQEGKIRKPCSLFMEAQK